MSYSQRAKLSQIEKSRLPATAVQSAARSSTSRRACPRLVEELPDPQPTEVTQYNRHHYECLACGTETVASHPDCPDEGQLGVNVIANTVISRYEYRLSYRKIADRLDQLHDLDLLGASAWHATERAAHAGRCEYEQIRRQIQTAEVVHVDESGIKRDGEQAWIWTFRTDEHTLYAVRESRGHDVPAEVLAVGFVGLSLLTSAITVASVNSTAYRFCSYGEGRISGVPA